MSKTLCALHSAFLLSLASQTGYGATVDLNGKHTLYLYSPSSQCRTVDVGDGKGVIYLKNELKGESVLLSDPCQKDWFLKSLRARLVFSESGQNFSCEYYYSPEIRAYTSINGQKVNVHVALSTGGTTIGIPMIFGSY